MLFSVDETQSLVRNLTHIMLFLLVHCFFCFVSLFAWVQCATFDKWAIKRFGRSGCGDTHGTSASHST